MFYLFQLELEEFSAMKNHVFCVERELFLRLGSVPSVFILLFV